MILSESGAVWAISTEVRVTPLGTALMSETATRWPPAFVPKSLTEPGVVATAIIYIADSERATASAPSAGHWSRISWRMRR